MTTKRDGKLRKQDQQDVARRQRAITKEGAAEAAVRKKHLELGLSILTRRKPPGERGQDG